MGSSPISKAVVVSPAKAYPLVFLLYPLLNVANLYSSERIESKCSTMGDLPVPPNDRFPTQIIGTLNFTDFKYCLLYIQFLKETMPPYNKANGKSKTLKDFKKRLLKFITIPRRNAMGQRYIKFMGILNPINRLKIRDADS